MNNFRPFLLGDIMKIEKKIEDYLNEEEMNEVAGILKMIASKSLPVMLKMSSNLFDEVNGTMSKKISDSQIEKKGRNKNTDKLLKQAEFHKDSFYKIMMMLKKELPRG